MRYISLFSGIEAASVAWSSLGWTCAAVAEVEPFPCAVLKDRYPDVPNLGDVTKITQAQIQALGPIDVIIYGFPCQDLSVAGQRKGLKHADGTHTRSGLFYIASQIAEWAGTRWSIAENVPGLLSSNKGCDFASVVGELAGAEIDVPKDRWENAGVALGPKGLVEWAVLDAQYCRVDTHPRAVPQRRRRVFIVRDSSGQWQRRQPLFLVSEGVRGDSPPSRSTGKEVAGSISARTKGGGGFGTDFEYGGGLPPAALCLSAARGQACANAADLETYIPVTHTLKAEGFDASEDGTGRGTPIIPVHCHEVAPMINAHFGEKQGLEDQHINGGAGLFIAFDTTQITSKTNRCNPKAGNPCHPLASGAHAPCIAFPAFLSSTQAQDSYAEDICPVLQARNPTAVATSMAVRRLTPTECARLQAFPDTYLDITFRGKPACDGVKYKALGNSMATNCIRWLGKRIEQLEKMAVSEPT